MILGEIVKMMEPLAVEGSLDREITGIAYDSRRVLPGHLFVAMRGERSDGHRFLEAAIERGAAATVFEQEAGCPPRVTRIRVADSRRSLALAAARFFDYPSQRLRVVGVTGTNGKTTTAFMTKAILDAAGLPSGLLGTVQYQIGERVIPASRTTPESVELQDLMRQMLRAGCRAASMEVSSHALDRHRVDAVDFDVAIFTNLSPEHLDYHRSMEEYFEVKSRLFLGRPRGVGAGRAVINIDDTYGRRLVARLEQLGARVGGGNTVLTYGVAHDATVCARDVRMTAAGTWFTAHTPHGAVAIALPLVGRFNVANALAAIAAAGALGVDLATIQAALAGLRPVPGRLERIGVGQPYQVYIDYAHTAAALRGALGAVGELTPGRVIVVFGCGGDRDRSKRQPMGWAACELADFSILTSDNPRTEDPPAIVGAIAAGFLPGAQRNYQVILDRREAIERALDIARAGDTVLIAGKGHEAYQEFADTVVPFNDREVVEDYFAQSGLRWTQCA